MKPNGALIICRAFLPASSVQVLPGRNLLVGVPPNPQDQNFVLAAHLKNASLSAQNKIVSTLTEFAVFEKSIAYECCYMV